VSNLDKAHFPISFRLILWAFALPATVWLAALFAQHVLGWNVQPHAFTVLVTFIYAALACALLQAVATIYSIRALIGDADLRNALTFAVVCVGALSSPMIALVALVLWSAFLR
jgi:hypothetical protein